MCLFCSEAVSAVRFIPFLQRMGKGRNKFPLQMIHASAVEAMGLGVFANGQTLHKTFLEIAAVAAQNRFQTILQKEQVTFKFPEVFFRYPDVPLLLDTESILGPAEPIPLAQLFGIFMVGDCAGSIPVIVSILRVSIRFPRWPKKTIFLKILHGRS